MKKIFVAILVAATLVACAKEDVISQNNEAIGFKQAFVDNSVRSVVDPSFSNTNLFDSFAVYGTVENAPLFNKVEVTGSGFGVSFAGSGFGVSCTGSGLGISFTGSIFLIFSTVFDDFLTGFTLTTLALRGFAVFLSRFLPQNGQTSYLSAS